MDLTLFMTAQSADKYASSSASFTVDVSAVADIPDLTAAVGADGSEDGLDASNSADLAKVTINAQLNDADGSETLFLDFSNLSNVQNLVAPDGTKVSVSNNQATLQTLSNWPKPYEIGIEANEHFSGHITGM